MLLRVLLALALGAVLSGGAFARCEGVVPQAKPQNSFVQDVGRDFDRILDEGWIEFAVYEDYAPWSWEEKGEATGVDVEIGKVIAAELGIEPRGRPARISRRTCSTTSGRGRRSAGGSAT